MSGVIKTEGQRKGKQIPNADRKKVQQSGVGGKHKGGSSHNPGNPKKMSY